ncbi:MAG: PLP-dependent aminotransferase family protein [Acidobacteria bacterium]|nr:PLP-dependent aminotransferase family protein [Acidobacteriota bacterium]
MTPVSLDPGAPSPLYLQLQRNLRMMIQRGDWQPGMRLPAVPEMAQRFEVHRLTVLKALAGLKRTGWVQTVQGRGSFVAPRLPEAPLLRMGREEHALPFQGSSRAAREHELGPWLGETLGRAQDPSLVSFSAGFPPADLLPGADLGRLFRHTMKDLGPEAWVYAHPEGHPPLLAALGRWLAQEGKPIPEGWGIRTVPGAQAGLALVVESLTVPGDRVLVESPCYVGILALLQALGREAVPVPVDRHGLDPERLETSLQRGEAKLLFTVPNFQNPTGMTLTRGRRERILAMTRQHGVTLVEDDVYGDLRFTGAPIPSFRSLEGADHVIHVGSFSKSLAAGLRLGHVIAPAGLLERMAPMQDVHTIALPTLSQAALARFLDEGGFHRHVLRLRRSLRQRRDAMLEAVQASFPEGTEFTEPKGGMHLWIMLPEDCSALDLHREALRQGLSFAPGPLFFADGRGANCLRLNFSTHPPERIREATARLGRLVHAHA